MSQPDRKLIERAVDVFTLMLGMLVGACTGVAIYGANPAGVGSVVALFLAAGCVLNLVSAVQRRQKHKGS